MSDGFSRTAQNVALFRALESARPHKRLFDDPYARSFIPLKYRLLVIVARWRKVNEFITRTIDRKYPAGPRGTAVVRTRVLDDWINDLPMESISQVLILGAGYDGRAYRLAHLRQCRVFEADQAATQQNKQRVVERSVSLDCRKHVTFVPIDLRHDNALDALTAAGVQSAPSLVIWEGVTNYLDAGTVDSTFGWLRAHLPSGSHLIFTYVNRALLDGFREGDSNEARWLQALAKLNEEWTFGLHPAEVNDFLEARGLVLEEDLSAAEAADRLLEPLDRKETASSYYRFVNSRFA